MTPSSPSLRWLLRFLKSLPLLLISPFLVLISAASLAAIDLFSKLSGTRKLVPEVRPSTISASVVIPNWNGKELLERYLPSVIAALEGHPLNEVIVVDNGSTDGSADFVRDRFPQVKLLALKQNLGFGGGSNAGFRAARNDIVVLLNSDMRVDPQFLKPLLEGFNDDKTFSVACQIFFTDAKKLRQETGLTQGWWENGGLRVRHRLDEHVQELFPCFYGGGGSCAYDRRKFLELGGFDELLAPFYLEDTDLGYMAWKRGWTNLYQPRSIVFHEHRGTIGKKFSAEYIESVLKKNFVLFAWKNIHSWSLLASHFFFLSAGGIFSVLFGDSPTRSSLSGLWHAALQLPAATQSRWRARSLAQISDADAFRRPLGGHFRDLELSQSRDDIQKVRVLFVSPYPINPPIHGGGVFMYQTVTEMAPLTHLHLIVLLDYAREIEAHEELTSRFASLQYLVRMEGKTKSFGSITPHAVREFRNGELAWMIHRTIYTQKIDVLQLEYTVLGQYVGGFRNIASILFEHDVYFQSISRGLPYMQGVQKVQAMFEYLRALRYELGMLPKPDRIQVCSRDNKEYLLSFLPALRGRIDDQYRAGITTSGYEFRPTGREPFTMLFLGSFRHIPNGDALRWFMREVLPRVKSKCPQARLLVIGSDPPPRHSLPDSGEGVELIGFVPDVRDALAQYSVFVCPILSGSGVRVKLLEAFAAGIPVVSTRLGAEGLATLDGEVCALTDDAGEFAQKILELFASPEKASTLAESARAYVVEHRDMKTMTRQLVDCYRNEVDQRRSGTAPGSSTRTTKA